MAECSAGWYELNLSSADNNASACCYYSAEKEEWLDEPMDVMAYWNGPGMQKLRAINAGKTFGGDNGCSNCYYFTNRQGTVSYFDFDSYPEWVLSPEQLQNFRLSKQEYADRALVMQATPLRLYMNFGFACNLSCRMCHQVPRRKELRRQVFADSILAWDQALRQAIDVTVIGGEPFALPEAVSFIRQFIEKDEYDPVKLTVCTNGTVHHKHWNTLLKKRKLEMAISLDSIGAEYENIRVDGEWDVVERNLLKFREHMATDRPEWSLQTNALILKTGVKRLPDFARWHAKHDIRTSFWDFISSRGTEDAFHEENILHNPHLLDDMPEWEGYFQEAIDILKKANLTQAHETLNHYRERVREAQEQDRPVKTQRQTLRGKNTWKSVFSVNSPEEFVANTYHIPLHGGEGNDYVLDERGLRLLNQSRMSNSFTEFLPMEGQGEWMRAEITWRDLPTGARRAIVTVQNQDFSELSAQREVRMVGSTYFMTVSVPLDASVKSLRLMFLPVGEGEVYLPSTVNMTVDESLALSAA